MKRFFFLLLTLTCLAGCHKRETLIQSGNRNGILHVGSGAEVQSLDPHLAGGTVDNNVLGAVYEGLVTLDEETLQIRPGAAERWEISPDGLIYTFHLRPGSKWSNGDPLTTRDFMFSFKRVLSPLLGSRYKDIFYPVKNAEALAKGTIADFSQVGFRAIDDSTLEITLSQPTAYFLTLMHQNPWYPVHAVSVEKSGHYDEPSSKWSRLAPYIGNGPFRIKEVRDHQHILVEKNPNYWDAAHVKLNAIYFYPSESDQGQELAFRAGQLHTTWDVPLSKIEAYQKNSPELIRIESAFESYFIRFNVTNAIFKDPRVRRAFTLAIDQDAIVKRVTRGGQTAAHAFTPPGLSGYVGPAGVPTDPAKARELLAEAGYPGGKGFPSVDFITISSEINQRIAEALQEMWRRELGVDVQLNKKEFKVYLDAIDNRVLDYTLGRGRWIAEFPDPMTFLSILVTGNGINCTGYADPAYDALVAAADREQQPAARIAAFQKAETYLLEQAPVAPIYFGSRTTLVQTSVKGWKKSPLGFHNYKDVWLEP